MKRKRLSQKLNRQTHVKSSDLLVASEFTRLDDEINTERSAYEALVLTKNDRENAESNTKPEKEGAVTAGSSSNSKKNAATTNSDSIVTANDKMNDTIGNTDETVKKMDEMISCAVKKAQKGRKRKQRSAAGKELNGPFQKASKKSKFDDNVFTSLLTGEYIGPQKVQLLKKRDIPKKQVQVEKTQKKLNKIQKMVVGGKIVDYIDEGDEETEEALIIPDSEDDENLESDGESENEEQEEELETEEDEEIDEEEEDVDDDNDDGSIWHAFVNDDEEQEVIVETENDVVKCCGGTDVDKNAESTVIDFDRKPFSSSDDSVQNGFDAFQWLIDPYDVKKFFKMAFQKKAFYVCRENPNYYGNLFSTAKFVEILRTEYVEYGTNVNVAVYKDQQRSTLNGVGKVYPWDIQTNIQAGCSIQFTNPQSFCDSVWYYCDLLQEIFGCFVGANTYMTPAGTAGFAPHWDDIDAFLLQLEGRKHWKVYAPVDEDEMLPRLPSDNFTDDDMAERTAVFDGWLEQGDLLYIPRGFIHQGYADTDVHSLHLTVSVCRNVAYADLLERVVPQAVSDFAEQRVDLRKSLPVGYLDMAGVLPCKYPFIKSGIVKLHGVLDDAVSGFCNYIKQLNESAVDMMAREFMKTALPPMLTEEEKNMTALCTAGSTLYDKKRNVFTKRTPIKLLRRHGQRLIYESEERCFIVHRMANSRVYEERSEVLFDLDVELAKGFATLLDTYPEWCLVSDLKCDAAVDNIRLAGLLYSNGLLMAKFEETKN